MIQIGKRYFWATGKRQVFNVNELKHVTLLIKSTLQPLQKKKKK